MVTAKPLTIVRSAWPAALLVKAMFSAACDKQADVANRCVTLAVNSVVLNGNRMQNMIPNTLTIFEVHRPPNLFDNLGKTKEK
eukprot:Skav206675  [mRNA]  locus=scaffold1895:88835:89083:+ [translate_table: standard]